MFFTKSKTASENGNIIVNFLKGLIVSMMISFALIVVLALSMKWFSLSEKLITPMNLAIKTISVLVGASIAVKGESKGLVKGIIFGLLYILVAFFSFSILSKTFVVDSGLILDVIFASLAGGIVGIIKVNSK